MVCLVSPRRTRNLDTPRRSNGLEIKRLRGYSPLPTRPSPTDAEPISDTIFDATWGFPGTTSENLDKTEHDGVFLLHTQHVDEYVGQFRPQCLRHSVSSAKHLNLDFQNFKGVKGTTFDRVLLAPIANIESFIKKCTPLEATAAAAFYVAATRARQSLAIVIDKVGHPRCRYGLHRLENWRARGSPGSAGRCRAFRGRGVRLPTYRISVVGGSRSSHQSCRDSSDRSLHSHVHSTSVLRVGRRETRTLSACPSWRSWKAALPSSF